MGAIYAHRWRPTETLESGGHQGRPEPSLEQNSLECHMTLCFIVDPHRNNQWQRSNNSNYMHWHALTRQILSKPVWLTKPGQKARLLQCSLHSLDGLQNLSVKFKPNKSNRNHPSFLYQQSRLEDRHLRWEIKHVTVTRQKHTFFALW